MYKRLEFHYGDTNGVEMELIHPGVLTKTASVTSDIQDFIKGLSMDSKNVYILVNALSAGEYYGSNRNGDYIAEPVLQKYHKHFEENGYVYKHHVNKDPKRSMGRVLFSSYNPEMHRVELVCRLDKSKDEKFIKRIEDGEYPAVSMGMRTPYDECSICHNKAKTLAQYCDHLKYEMNHVKEDGRKVMAINPAAKFFDISFVIIPADPTAGVMQKIASLTPVISSASAGEEFLREASLKEADLSKVIEVPAEVQTITKDPKGNIYYSQPEIPKKDIIALTKNATLGEALSTLAGMRIMPTAADFQKLALYSQGHGAASDELDRLNLTLIDVKPETKATIPEDLDLANFNDGLAKKASHLIRERSLTKPLVITRILEKVASESRMEELGMIPPKRNPLLNDPQADEFYLRKEPSLLRKALLGTTEEPKLLPYKNPVVASAALSSLYYGLHKFNGAINEIPNIGKYDAFLMRRPWLIPLLIGATSYAAVNYQKGMSKTAAGNPIATYLLAVPTTYIYSGLQENKVRRGEPIGAFQNMIRKHPFISTFLTGAAMGSVQKTLLKYSSTRENILKVVNSYPTDKLNELLEDVINI